MTNCVISSSCANARAMLAAQAGGQVLKKIMDSGLHRVREHNLIADITP